MVQKTRTLAASNSIIQMGPLPFASRYVYAQLYAHIICWLSIQIQESHAGQLRWLIWLFTNKWRAYLRDEWDMIFIYLFWGRTITLATSSELRNINIHLTFYCVDLLTYFQVVEWLQLIYSMVYSLPHYLITSSGALQSLTDSFPHPWAVYTLHFVI